MLIASYFILFIGVLLTSYAIFVKSRGSFHYWIRPYHTPESWALGSYLPLNSSEEAETQALVDANAALRSLDQRSSQVIREWDKESGQLFIGVLLSEPLEEELIDGLVIRHFPQSEVLRLSGKNRADEISQLAAVQNYANSRDLDLDFSRPCQVSGQSFRLYQWWVKAQPAAESQSFVRRLEEFTLQMRDNAAFTILLTIISVGLLGTRQPILFAAGVGLMVLLSGACKFVFIHQRADEADEIHLQNY